MAILFLIHLDAQRSSNDAIYNITNAGFVLFSGGQLMVYTYEIIRLMA